MHKDAAFGLWRARKDIEKDGVAYQRRLRAEWDDRSPRQR